MFRYCVVAIALSCAAVSAQAQTVRAEGAALIVNEDLIKAKQMAIQDAMRQATLQAGARVESSTQIDESAMISDSLRVRAIGILTNMVVLDEWIEDDDDIFKVLIKAEVTDHNDDEVAQQQQNQYRRKVAVTQFRVSDRRQIHDMPNIEVNLAREITRRLQAENFIALDVSEYLLPESIGPYEAMGQTQGNVIVDLANRLGVQFIVTGIIHDMGVTEHPMWVQLRHAEIEMIVLDGVTGTMVSRHRGNDTIRENRLFDFPTTSPVMDDKFFASPIGYATHKIISTLIAKVSYDMRQLPFTARVIQAKGNRIRFDVGALSQVKVGDILMAYRVATEPTMNAMGQEFLGYEESPASSVVVKMVQPQFAIGELESESAKLQVGDILRFVW